MPNERIESMFKCYPVNTKLHNVNHTSLIVLNSLHDKSIHVSSIGLNIRLSSAAGNSVMSFNMLLFSFNDVP